VKKLKKVTGNRWLLFDLTEIVGTEGIEPFFQFFVTVNEIAEEVRQD
jgi:hypothetical protein